MSQAEKVLKRMKEHRYADNFWSQKNYILRLAARIKDLRNKGYDIIGYSRKEFGRPRKYWKNYYYFLA